jgi:hypothetical protein
MGFWHTGYIEFHEPVGLDRDWSTLPGRYVCARCGQSFPSEDDFRRHRFEEHPLRRLRLFFLNPKLGTQRVRISRHIEPAQISVESADDAEINGKCIPVAKIGRELAKVSDGVCTVRLRKNGIDATFELEIQVASDEDLLGVEKTFDAQSRA